MQFFKVLPFLFVLAAAFDPEKEIIPTCNSNDDSGNSTSSDNGFSKACSNANINADGWLYVDCDVGSKLMKFGVGLNYCIANDGGNIAVRDDGMAMDTQGCKDSCKATVTKGKSAKMKCDADDCKGEVDLDKAITFNGSYLKCGKHIGSGATSVKRSGMRAEDL